VHQHQAAGTARVMETHINIADAGVGGAIVVFAKCPIPGASKTRLAPLLGPEGAALLAQAMLSDILVSLNECPLLSNTLKVLVYAPGIKSGEDQMVSILQSLHLPYYKMDTDPSNAQSDQMNHPSQDRGYSVNCNGWILLPMKSSAPTELTSSTLGDKLEDALDRTRELLIHAAKSSAIRNSNTNEAVLFLGMDSPELPLEEIVYGLQIASGNRNLPKRENNRPPTNENTYICGDDKCAGFVGKAHLCPANDGGYGLLSVPKHAPSSKIFAGVRWSHSLTAVSQLKALTDSNVDVSLGRLMFDIDEPSDVQDLARRLVHSRSVKNRNNHSSSGNQANDMLTNVAAGSSHVILKDTETSYPHLTWKRLLDLNVICEDENSFNGIPKPK